MTHICIDGLQLALPYDNGIGTYTRNLAAALTDLGHELTVLYGRNVRTSRHADLREAYFFTPSVIEGRALPYRIRRAARSFVPALVRPQPPIEIARTGLVVRDERFDIGHRLLNSRQLFFAAHLRFRLTGTILTVPNPGGVTICHWTSIMPIQMKGAKNYYTFHDLIPVRYPYLAGGSPSHFYGIARAVAARASHIVTVSEHSRRELISFLGVPEDRVTNTYQSVAIPAPSPTDNGVLQWYGLAPEQYFFHFSATDPRKNIVRMIEAYLASGSARKLVVAGEFNWLGADDIRLLTNRGLWDGDKARPTSGGNILFVGHVPRAHLDQLIRSARAVLFPSITEGFGLPIIEAMGRGVPVMTSRCGATEEIAGGGALLVDALDTGSLTAAIRELDTNTALTGKLGREGPSRAEMFSEAAYRNRLSALYGA